MASSEPSTVMDTALSFGLADLPGDLRLEEFTRFPLLPIELRLKIWALSLPGPRIIEVFCEEWEFEEEPGEPSVSFLRCRSMHQFPAALHVCRDSRQESLKQYTPSFGCGSDSEIYFNFATDTLAITCYGLNGADYLMNDFLEHAVGLRKVRKMAICTAIDEYLYQYLGGRVTLLKSLETLIMTDDGHEIKNRESLQIDLQAGEPPYLSREGAELLEQWKKGGPKREVVYGKLIEGGKD